MPTYKAVVDSESRVVTRGLFEQFGLEIQQFRPDIALVWFSGTAQQCSQLGLLPHILVIEETAANEAGAASKNT